MTQLEKGAHNCFSFLMSDAVSFWSFTQPSVWDSSHSWLLCPLASMIEKRDIDRTLTLHKPGRHFVPNNLVHQNQRSHVSLVCRFILRFKRLTEISKIIINTHSLSFSLAHTHKHSLARQRVRKRHFSASVRVVEQLFFSIHYSLLSHSDGAAVLSLSCIWIITVFSSCWKWKVGA